MVNYNEEYCKIILYLTNYNKESALFGQLFIKTLKNRTMDPIKIDITILAPVKGLELFQ
jgi:hypothetical protein